MVTKVFSAALHGIDAYIVEVEIYISNGLPIFDIVGLPDTSVKESRERVKASIKNMSFDFPIKKITVNLAPADRRKEGPAFDLPIAVGILSACGYIPKDLSEFLFLGELSLGGEVKPVSGVLPVAIMAAQNGFKKLIIPEENMKEASVVDNIKIYGISNLKDLVEFLNGKLEIHQAIHNIDNISPEYDLDFADVKGQDNAKRAMEIAAAGGHNLLLIGPPGSGKTMIAKRMPTILPRLSFEEALEVTKIYSISGLLKGEQFITKRPFRAPHHTISTASLVGGGTIPKPGEVSLAHYGVLFLDELPEFRRDCLEALRQPLEDKYVTISRVNGNFQFPSQFSLIAAMNPCPCGYYGSTQKECRCTPLQIRKYLDRISGPLLDRIDIFVDVSPIEYKDIENSKKSMSSKEIREKVEKARKIQRERYKGINIFCNAELNQKQLSDFVVLDAESKMLIRKAFMKMKLSTRAYTRILKVARTIADLAGCENVSAGHIAEALQYRLQDNRYW